MIYRFLNVIFDLINCNKDFSYDDVEHHYVISYRGFVNISRG